MIHIINIQRHEEKDLNTTYPSSGDVESGFLVSSEISQDAGLSDIPYGLDLHTIVYVCTTVCGTAETTQWSNTACVKNVCVSLWGDRNHCCFRPLRHRTWYWGKEMSWVESKLSLHQMPLLWNLLKSWYSQRCTCNNDVSELNLPSLSIHGQHCHVTRSSVYLSMYVNLAFCFHFTGSYSSTCI